MSSQKTPIRRTPAWLIVVAIGLSLVIAAAFAPLAIALEVLILVVATVALTGKVAWLRPRSRRLPLLALGSAGVLLAVSIGAAATAAGRPSTEEALAIASVHEAAAAPGAPAGSKVAPLRLLVIPSPETVRITESQVVPYERMTAEDPSLPRGQTVVTPGVEGSRTLTYEVTTLVGRETDRTLVSDVVTTAAITEVTTTGTYDPPPPVIEQVAAPAADGCDANYADNCVPIASDVDCAGGSGNGPAYLSGTARVVGRDVYDLDRDQDGVACN